jgi:protocatechuate 3,4-dioxygenase beta subunit
MGNQRQAVSAQSIANGLLDRTFNGIEPSQMKSYFGDPVIMQETDKRRRQFLYCSLLATAGVMTPASAALMVTPSQSRGPFYPAEIPLDSDNDLVWVEGMDRQASGSICDLRGRVLDVDGSPLNGALVEIWQCDALGRYHHVGGRGGRGLDPAFQGYGAFRTAADGRYRFRTIRPVAYPGRTPHIHFAVRAPGRRELVTQLYVEGEPRNQRDFLYRRIPQAQRASVTVPFVPSQTDEAELMAAFDLILP